MLRGGWIDGFGTDDMGVIKAILTEKNVSEWDPEARVMLSFLAYIISTADRETCPNYMPRNENKRCREFIDGKSFDLVCDLLNLDSGYLRRKIGEARKRGIKLKFDIHR